MIVPSFETLAQTFIVLILATAGIIIVKRDLASLIRMYALQSLLLAAMAVLFFLETGAVTLLFLAILIIVSKTVIIPYVMRHITKRLNIKRDMEFNFLSPQKALFASIFIILFVYVAFSQLLSEINFYNSRLFFLGATVGLSIMFMGMMVIFTRKQTITNIVGYLTMENGVVLFSLFLVELPLLVEILIVIDLIILTLLATVLAFGIDSSIEEFHARLNPFQNQKKDDKNRNGNQPKNGHLEDDD
jgi:hydrogenase-4 component E